VSVVATNTKNNAHPKVVEVTRVNRFNLRRIGKWHRVDECYYYGATEVRIYGVWLTEEQLQNGLWVALYEGKNAAQRARIMERYRGGTKAIFRWLRERALDRVRQQQAEG
jgi:hypothetical protein